MSNELQQRIEREVQVTSDQEAAALQHIVHRAEVRHGLRRGVAAVVAVAIFLAVPAWILLDRESVRPQTQAGGAESFRVVGAVNVGPKGQVTALTTSGASIWVGGYDDAGGFVRSVDPMSLEVGQRVATPIPSAVTAEGDRVWLAGGDTSDEPVLQLLGTGSSEGWTQSLPVTAGLQIALSESALWVAGADSSTGRGARLLGFDPATGAALAEVPLPNGVPRAIVSSGGTIWVAEADMSSGMYTGDDSLVNIDPSNETILSTTNEFGSPIVLDGQIWGTRLGDHGESSLVSLDPRSGEVVTHLSRDLHAPGLASADGLLWFVTDGGVGAFDPAADTEVGAIGASSSAVVAFGGSTSGRLWLLSDAGTLEAIAPG